VRRKLWKTKRGSKVGLEERKDLSQSISASVGVSAKISSQGRKKVGGGGKKKLLLGDEEGGIFHLRRWVKFGGREKSLGMIGTSISRGRPD